MKEIRLGIIGTNFISDWLVEAMENVEGIAATAVFSRTSEKGKEFANKHGIDAVFTDMESFLSSGIDAVYVATPNFCHYEQTMKALRHHKHVLVEKPAAHNLIEWKRMCECAKEHGCVLMEAMRPGHDPAYDRVREAMKELGEIRSVVFEFCQYSSRYDAYRAGNILNAFNPALGNAALMDIGCYAVHVCTMLFGSPEDITAHSVMLPNGMEGMGNVFLNYGTFHANIRYSKITESVFPSVITGEDGSITIGKISTGDTITWLPRKKDPVVLMQPSDVSNMVYEIRDFRDCVLGKSDPAVFIENTTKAMAVMDEIRRQNNIVFPEEIRA